MVFHTAVEHFWRNWEAAEQTQRHLCGNTVIPHIITSNVEHDSVKLAAEHLRKTQQAGRKREKHSVSDYILQEISILGFKVMVLSQM